MGWDSDIVALVPVALSSIIASVSALIKFKKFPEQQEVILQAQSLLTHTLSNARNQDDLSHSLLKEYHESLEKLETSIYPDIRKKFLRQSHNNLISIMKQETKFFNLINKVNNGEVLENDDSLSSNSNERNPLSIDSPIEETL
jgi:hypothetical protein